MLDDFAADSVRHGFRAKLKNLPLPGFHRGQTAVLQIALQLLCSPLNVTAVQGSSQRGPGNGKHSG